MDIQHCAECGNLMPKKLDEPYTLCCNGYGYWYNKGPLQRDSWWPVTKRGEFYFYPTVKWPVNQKPKLNA